VERVIARPAGRRSRGQSFVEFALVLPVFLLLLLGAVDFGRVFMSSIAVNNSARAGAIQASITPNEYAAIAGAVTKEVANVISDQFQGITCTGVGLAQICSASPQPAAVITIECLNGSTAVACPAEPTLGLRARVSVSVPFGFLTPGVTTVFGAGAIQVSSAGVSDQLSLPTPLVPAAVATPIPTSSPEPRCVVPNLDNLKDNIAQNRWDGAGFTGALALTYGPGGPGGWYVEEGSQTLMPAASWPCPTAMTVRLVNK
jgi:Flp pilus assembly protein TadG